MGLGCRYGSPHEQDRQDTIENETCKEMCNPVLPPEDCVIRTSPSTPLGSPTVPAVSARVDVTTRYLEEAVSGSAKELDYVKRSVYYGMWDK